MVAVVGFEPTFAGVKVPCVAVTLNRNIWLRVWDSNPKFRLMKPTCCLYTNPQYKSAERLPSLDGLIGQTFRVLWFASREFAKVTNFTVCGRLSRRVYPARATKTQKCATNLNGGGGGIRTHKEPNFEFGASANCATPPRETAVIFENPRRDGFGKVNNEFS